MSFKTMCTLACAASLFLALSTSVRASLPYYNSTLGYTIWLGDGWVEAPDSLDRFEEFRDGLPTEAQEWEAVYTLGGAGGVSLLVSRLHGKMISSRVIADFNRHVVRRLKKLSGETAWNNRNDIRLRKANYDKAKSMLRLEMDATGPSGGRITSVVYIVYARGSMLKFVGLAPSGDRHGVRAIDAAVSTLYLDRARPERDLAGTR